MFPRVIHICTKLSTELSTIEMARRTAADGSPEDCAGHAIAPSYLHWRPLFHTNRLFIHENAVFAHGARRSVAPKRPGVDEALEAPICDTPSTRERVIHIMVKVAR